MAGEAGGTAEAAAALTELPADRARVLGPDGPGTHSLLAPWQARADEENTGAGQASSGPRTGARTEHDALAQLAASCTDQDITYTPVP